jgi:TonB-linked SusC/RagA family outer membrane protein
MVTIKGKGIGAITDVNGHYTLNVNKSDILVFTYVGMTDKEVVVGENSRIDVVMEIKANQVDEIVVVGYGVQRKASVVGAISQVNSQELQQTGGVTSVSAALNGLVPGLVTIAASGKPGQENASILIRGVSTWNDTSPLILIDGVERDMNDIDINEVETISVLKDASATAVYGVRGGNGVVLITTKRGTEGKISFNVYGNATLKSVSRVPTLLDSYNGRIVRNFAIENQLGIRPELWEYMTTKIELQHFRDQDMPYRYPNVDWQSEMMKDFCWSQKYGVDLSGGTKFVKYFGSVSYIYDGDILRTQNLGQGYVPKNDYNRINVRSNFDFQLTKSTVLSADIDVAVGMENTMGAPPAVTWKGMWRKAPDEYPARYEDGTFGNNTNLTDTQNTVEVMNFSGANKQTRTDANASFRLKQGLDFITKGLSLNGNLSFRNYFTTTGA